MTSLSVISKQFYSLCTHDFFWKKKYKNFGTYPKVKKEVVKENFHPKMIKIIKKSRGIRQKWNYKKGILPVILRTHNGEITKEVQKRYTNHSAVGEELCYLKTKGVFALKKWKAVFYVVDFDNETITFYNIAKKYIDRKKSVYKVFKIDKELTCLYDASSYLKVPNCVKLVCGKKKEFFIHFLKLYKLDYFKIEIEEILGRIIEVEVMQKEKRKKITKWKKEDVLKWLDVMKVNKKVLEIKSDKKNCVLEIDFLWKSILENKIDDIRLSIERLKLERDEEICFKEASINLAKEKHFDERRSIVFHKINGMKIIPIDRIISKSLNVLYLNEYLFYTLVNSHKSSHRVKILVFEERSFVGISENSILGRLEGEMKDFFHFFSNVFSITRFHQKNKSDFDKNIRLITVLLIGEVCFLWGRSGIMIPLRWKNNVYNHIEEMMDNKVDNVGFDLLDVNGKSFSDDMINYFTRKAYSVCVKYNLEHVYRDSINPNERYKRSNCQDFIDEVLELIQLPVYPKNYGIRKFIHEVRKNGTSPMEITFSEEFRKTFNTPKKMIFKTHKELDLLLSNIEKKDKGGLLQKKFPEEIKLINSFHEIFFIKMREFEDVEEIKPDFLLCSFTRNNVTYV